MATHMLEGGADIRVIQEILGHAEMSTTAIYTRVSIKHLKAVHDQTHPAAKLLRRVRVAAEPAVDAPPPTADELLAALEGEADDNEDGAKATR